MKKVIVIILLCVAVPGAVRGQLTIQECYDRAALNYPLVHQYDLIRQSEAYSLANARRGYLPQFAFSAQATYQTDVTNIRSVIPSSLSGYLDDITIPAIPKDQYQILGEVQQVIWDGGTIRAARDAIMAQGDVEMAQYEVNMYALRERINSIYFGILLIDEQLRLNGIFADELQVNYDRVRSYMDNGVANASDLDAVAVEQVAARQNRIQLEAARMAYLNMLSAFVGEPIGPDVKLERPFVRYPVVAMDISRPELALYDAMAAQAETQRRNITAGNMPKLGLFVQGGYGNPGLNMFKDKFTAYAIGGVKLTWNFGSFYTRRNDLLKISTQVRNIEVQKEAYLFNARLEQTQHTAELGKYQGLLAEDEEVIRMRRSILTASEAKLDNGIITVPDLIRDINAYQNAQVNKAVHEIEMLQTIYALKNLSYQ